MPLSDFLSFHCPATPQTCGMMTAEKFAMLPGGSLFVNVACGALVDETALMAALDSGKLSAAGLYCFVTKPGGNPALAGYDNVFMLPHIGSSTGATRDAMGFWPLDNLDAFCRKAAAQPVIGRRLWLAKKPYLPSSSFL